MSDVESDFEESWMFDEPDSSFEDRVEHDPDWVQTPKVKLKSSKKFSELSGNETSSEGEEKKVTRKSRERTSKSNEGRMVSFCIINIIVFFKILCIIDEVVIEGVQPCSQLCAIRR